MTSQLPLSTIQKDDAIKYVYGTAGFRTAASTLDPICYRVGLLAVLRSLSYASLESLKDNEINPRGAIGAMITASHNPEEDNGIKIIEPMGDMLKSAWETHATLLAETSNADLPARFEALLNMPELSLIFNRLAAVKTSLRLTVEIIYGIDTRESGVRLMNALQAGIRDANDRIRTKLSEINLKITYNGSLNYVGKVTTPILHYLVRCTNTHGRYGTPSVPGYFEKLSCAYNNLVSLSTLLHPDPVIKIDCANGIGYLIYRDFVEYNTKQYGETLRLEFHNTGDGPLNKDCGADYVKLKHQISPKMEAAFIKDLDIGAVIDGDADRLLMYIKQTASNKDRDDDRQQQEVTLLDGDKMAVLFAQYITGLLDQIGIAYQTTKTNMNSEAMTIAVVYTAYSNNAAIQYLETTLNIPTLCTITGVKNLHHEAAHFDVGIYLEPNGHGTILFSNTLKSYVLNKINTEIADMTAAQTLAAYEFLNVINLTNESVGDALSLLLLIHAIILTRHRPSIPSLSKEALIQRIKKIKIHHEHDNLRLELSSSQQQQQQQQQQKGNPMDLSYITCLLPEAVQKMLDGNTKHDQFTSSKPPFSPNNSQVVQREVFARYKEWYDLYESFANIQIVKKVHDKAAYLTTNQDRDLVAPEIVRAGIQAALAAYTGQYARCFVRPSGTENAIRIYAECDDPKKLMKIANSVSNICL